MTTLKAEGYEGYAAGSDMASLVTSFNSASFLGAGSTAFNRGQCAFGLNITDTFDTAANETTIFMTVRLKYGSVVNSANAAQFVFSDGTNDQVTIQWLGDKSVVVRSGGTAGSILGTFPAAFFLNVWDSWQVKIVINATTGSVEFKKNGDTSVAFSVTGVNTRAGSGNSYANKYSAIIGTTWLIDDLFMNNNDGTAPTGWPADLRAVEQAVTGAGDSTMFLPDLATRTYGQTTDLFTTVATANSQFMIVFGATASGPVSEITIKVHTGFTGHIKGAIYSVTGLTGRWILLDDTAEETNPSSGLLVLTLGAPVQLERGELYGIAILTDAAVTLDSCNTSGYFAVVGAARSYGAGFIPLFDTGVGASIAPFMTVDQTPDNWSLVNESSEDGDTTYVQSSTVNDLDLYTLAPLGVTPSAIVGVQATAIWRKQNSGARTVSLMYKANGSAATVETTVSLSVGYTVSRKFMPLDPTAAAFTQLVVEGAQVGAKVIS